MLEKIFLKSNLLKPFEGQIRPITRLTFLYQDFRCKEKKDEREDIFCRLFTRPSRPSAIRESVETWSSFRQAELVSRAARKTSKKIQRKRRKTNERDGRR